MTSTRSLSRLQTDWQVLVITSSWLIGTSLEVARVSQLKRLLSSCSSNVTAAERDCCSSCLIASDTDAGIVSLPGWRHCKRCHRIRSIADKHRASERVPFAYGVRLFSAHTSPSSSPAKTLIASSSVYRPMPRDCTLFPIWHHRAICGGLATTIDVGHRSDEGHPGIAGEWLHVAVVTVNNSINDQLVNFLSSWCSSVLYALLGFMAIERLWMFDNCMVSHSTRYTAS